MKKIQNLFIPLIIFSLFLLNSCAKEDNKVKKESNLTEANVRNNDAQSNLEYIVPEHIARQLAQKINVIVPEIMRVGAVSSQRLVDGLHTINDDMGIPALYIANYKDDGFIVISADERHVPICAVVEHGKYSATDIPSGMLDWFNITIENISKIRLGVAVGNNYANQEWLRVVGNADLDPSSFPSTCCPECPNYPECLIDPFIGCGEPDLHCNGGGNGDPCSPYFTIIKGPLLSTLWGQDCTYNEMCPDKDCGVCSSNENAWTGCIATAISQVLRYWSSPSSQNYDYSSMPNSWGNGEVQRMMRDVGDSVDMDYGCSGSSAYGDEIPKSLKSTFGFGSAERDNYTSGSYQKVIQNIDSEQPVILDGCSTKKKKNLGLWTVYSSCHAWVCDGYEDSSNKCYSILKFHMNWGWDGRFNGWYYYNTWNPQSFNFQYVQNFTHNIKP